MWYDLGMQKQRNEKGHFLPGYKMSDSHRENIRRSQIERNIRIREELKHLPKPDMKRCTECKKFLHVEAFPLSTRTLATGEKIKYPNGRCKNCENKWKKKHRDELRATGELQKQQKRWRENSKRKYGTIRKPDHLRVKPKEEVERVDIAPLGEYLRRAIQLDEILSLDDLAEKAGTTSRTLQAAIHGTLKTVNVDIVDRILIAVDDGVFLWDLYPHLYNND